MDGVVNVHKPLGPTSHDIIYTMRRIFGQKKIGHAGTLDPMATGVLVVCLGKGTRIVEYLMGAPKEYRAKMILGQSTDTEDSTGVVLRETDASAVTKEAFEEATRAFIGEIDQIPPMVSAIKLDGKPLYKLAREGKSVERQARRVTVQSIDVLDFVPGVCAEAEIMVRCSSGTYIRTLCSDIGDRLGCGANMSMLQRTRVGRFSIEDAATPEQLEQARIDGRLEDFVMSINDALCDMPYAEISESASLDALHGLVIPIDGDWPDGDTIRMLAPDGRLVGLGIVAEKEGLRVAKPKKILDNPDCGAGRS
ncbi:MAG: tRNA pseudouridine(55) synthase TruB [Armatimonadota bacterium]|nr:tRNA pseudouridine(55) synthase TruB [bacterium]